MSSSTSVSFNDKDRKISSITSPSIHFARGVGETVVVWYTRSNIDLCCCTFMNRQLKTPTNATILCQYFLQRTSSNQSNAALRKNRIPLFIQHGRHRFSDKGRRVKLSRERADPHLTPKIYIKKSYWTVLQNHNWSMKDCNTRHDVIFAAKPDWLWQPCGKRCIAGKVIPPNRVVCLLYTIVPAALLQNCLYYWIHV